MCGWPRLRRFVLVVLVVVAALVPNLVSAQENADWSGVWDSSFRGGGVMLFLQQTGDRVEGTFPVVNGTLSGRVEGRLLKGEWEHPAASGTFTFAMAPDGRSFMGRFGIGEWWTASRLPASEVRSSGALVAPTPDRALFQFMQAGNQIREGRIDRLGPALRLLDFSDVYGADEPTGLEQLRQAAALFWVLDRLTFRAFDLRAPGNAGEEFTYRFEQAGTDIPFDLTFRPVGEGDDVRWKIVVPPMAVLTAAEERLLVGSGGRRPHSYAHHELHSPRDTMRTFIEQWDADTPESQELVLQTLDLSQIPIAVREEEGLLKAEFLKEVIDRIGYVLWQEIPDDPEGEPYVHFVHPDGRVEIVRQEREDGTPVWRFSSDTLDGIRGLFVALEDMPPEDGLKFDTASPFFALREHIRGFNRSLLDQIGPIEIWQWLALAAYVLVSIPISWLLARLIAAVFRLRGAPDDVLSAHTRFLWPIRLLLVAQFGRLGLSLLGLPQAVELPVRFAIGLATAIAGGWLAFHLVDKFSRFYSDHAERIGYRDEILRSLATSTTKLLVVVGAFLYLAEVLSIPWQGVIAGLGVGGIAVALAAQSTVANFIGGITLFADKPIRVGDFCRFGDQMGTVEAIGLRSVKIRSLDRTIVSIPNAEFVNLYLENFARRDMILLKTTVELRYETTPDQLRWILAEFRKLLLQHPKVTEAPARARFEGFGAHSLNVGIFAYVRTSDINEFLAVQEDIYLRIIDIVDSSGTGFAFPSNVTYFARDTGIDGDRKERVEQIVARLRENDELPFPDFDADARYGMMDQMEYPAPGSPDSRRAQQRRRPQAAD